MPTAFVSICLCLTTPLFLCHDESSVFVLSTDHYSYEKEKIEEKLRKLKRTVINKKTTAGTPHTTSHHAAKKRKLHWKTDFAMVHKHFLNASGSGRPCPCEPALLVLWLILLRVKETSHLYYWFLAATVFFAWLSDTISAWIRGFDVLKNVLIFYNFPILKKYTVPRPVTDDHPQYAG